MAPAATLPLVSVCVPNRNHAAFLQERFKSIALQTYRELEILVVDGHSDDHSWLQIEEFAREDSRVRAWQAAPRGIYQAWNDCITKSHGDYIYIATSDDTMSPDCIEKLVAASESVDDPVVAQCGLQLIDESSLPLPADQQWTTSPIARFLSNWIAQPHVRPAPLDGILHAAIGSVFTSHTQILVDRRIYDRIGLYRTKWGSIADFEWGMRASLLYDTVHIPDCLATWRQHDDQQSGTLDLATDGRYLLEMTRQAYREAVRLDPSLERRVSLKELLEPVEVVSAASQILGARTLRQKGWNSLRLLYGSPVALQRCLWAVLRGGRLRHYRQKMARRLTKKHTLSPCEIRNMASRSNANETLDACGAAPQPHLSTGSMH
jgi:glycosyltransferase involved in cell wall biosynthesis